MTDVQVRGKYLKGDDTPAAGQVTFAPRPRSINDSGDSDILVSSPVIAVLDEAGEFTVTLQASDDPTLEPSGWTYRVRELIVGASGVRAYDIDIPVAAAGPGIDLWDVAPASPASGDPTLFPTLAAFAALEAEVDAAIADKAPLVASARFDPAGKPNGTVTVLDTGQAVTNFGNSPISVVSGKLQHSPAASPQQAGYIQLNAGARVHRVGLMVAWQPNSTGAIAIVIPSAPWSQGVLPVAGIHLVMFGNGIWHCSRWTGSGEAIYADYTTHGRYATVWDGIARPIDLWIDTDTDTCTLFFPDGTSTTFTDVAIGADTGNYAIWELYETSGSVDVAATIGEIWADTYTPAESAVLLTKPEAVELATAAKRTIYEYATPGTYNQTIPGTCQGVLVTLVASGGGGGSGRQGAPGSVRNGGSSGGSGGIISEQWLPKSALGGTYQVIVPAGGAGGAAVATPDTNGTAGANGAPATFSSGSVFLRALAGGAGPGGTATAGAGGGAGAPLSVGGVPPSSTGGVGTTGSASNNGAAGVPGAGGGITAGDVPGNGGPGSASNLWSATGVGGAGGVVDGTVPGQGAVAVAGRPGDGPGGGAASVTTAAQAGANARGYGAGGAGGGASTNGNPSGKGGDAYTGFARVTIVTL